MTAPWDAAAAERLNTWILDVAATLLPTASARDEGTERRFSDSGGLTINVTSGAWYSHAAAVGGRSALGLIRHLRQAYDRTTAIDWALAWLSAHPGIGSIAVHTDDAAGEAHAAASRIAAERILARLQPVTGTLAEEYLHSRGLKGPWPDCIGSISDARAGEAGLAAKLTANGRTVGLQLTYISALGTKSLVLPNRRRFDLEKTPGAVFTVRADGDGPTMLCEGLEDAMSVFSLSETPVIGLPGIAALAHLDTGNVPAFTVVRDGDAPNSPASKSLTRGVDHLLLAGATVLVTDTPAGQDANSILQSDADALCALIAEAAPAELSLEGDAQRLAALDTADSDRERKAVAKRHGVQLRTLDAMVTAARPKKSADATADAFPEDEPWEGPVDLCEALDAALVEARRYIVAPDSKLAAMVLWAGHTHLVHNPGVGLQRSPRLALQSRGPGCGKTTGLEIVAALSFRAVVRSSATASTILRTLGSVKRTYCLDEADRQLNDKNSDLIAILDAGDRRSTAVVERSVPTAEGGWKVEAFNVWGAVAFAGIDELPATLQDRSIRVFLQRATGMEVPEHLRDGTSAALTAIRRQLAAWSDSLFDLPDPVLPDVLRRQAGRVGDCWRPLIAIADMAGGKWPDLARQAALEEITAEKRETLVERLLASIRRAFDAAPGNPAAPDNRDRLTTTALVQALLDDPEEDWRTAYRGRPITAYFLRDKLRGLVAPPEAGKAAGAADWWTGPADTRQHHRGYLRLQFDDAWCRHLPDTSNLSNTPLGHPVHPVHPVQDRGDPQKPVIFCAPDAAPDEQNPPMHPVQQKRPKTAIKSTSAPDAPDAPDAGGGAGENIFPSEDTTPKATVGSAHSTPGNGKAPSADDLIREFAASNPGKSPAWIAKQLGQTVEAVTHACGTPS